MSPDKRRALGACRKEYACHGPSRKSLLEVHWQTGVNIAQT